MVPMTPWRNGAELLINVHRIICIIHTLSHPKNENPALHHIGFRNNCASRYHPFQLDNQAGHAQKKGELIWRRQYKRYNVFPTVCGLFWCVFQPKLKATWSILSSLPASQVYGPGTALITSYARSRAYSIGSWENRSYPGSALNLVRPHTETTVDADFQFSPSVLSPAGWHFDVAATTHN